jgi:hypothetical protein
MQTPRNDDDPYAPTRVTPNDPAVELLEVGALCLELKCPPPDPNVAPAAPIVMVSRGLPPLIEPTDDDPRRPRFEECSPRSALVAADYLINHAIHRAPGLRASVELGSLIDQIWPALRDNAYDLIKPGPRASRMLRSWIAREVQDRVNEEIQLRREAARLHGLAQAQDVIKRLWAVASEESPAARAVSMASIAAEVRPFV